METHSEEPPVSPVFQPSAPTPRRAFLRTLAAVGGATLLAACGGAPLTPSQGSAATSAPVAEPPAATAIAPILLSTVAPGATSAPNAAGQPKIGGTYRMLSSEDVASLDAALAFSYTDAWASMLLLYNRLYFYDRDGRLYADLAADMPQVSDDKLTYTIPLRKGVKFHNGRELTAEDVKFTFDRVMDPKLLSPGASYNTIIVGAEERLKGKAEEVSGVQVVDPYTVKFTIKQPQATFPGIMTIITNGIVPKQEVLEADKNWGVSTVIGTGPFKFGSLAPGEKMTFERNSEFFRTGRPYLNTVEVGLKVEPSVGVLRWESGEAEYIFEVPAPDVQRVNADPTLKERVRVGPSLIFDYMRFVIAKPFDDVRVRQAVAYAIDRATLVQRTPNSAPIEGLYTSRLLQYNSSFKSKYPYNPEKAKQLLAEAGHANGISGIKVFFPNSGNGKIAGELIQADLQKVGISAEIVTGDRALFKDQIDSGEVSLVWYGFGADFPDAGSLVNSRLVCPINPAPAPTFYCSTAIDDAYNKTDTLPLDGAERTSLFGQIQEIAVNEDVVMIPLVERLGYGLGQNYIKDDGIHVMIGLPELETAYSEQA